MQTLLRRVLRTLRRLPVVLHVRIRRVRPPPVLPHHRGDQRVPVGLLALVHLHSAVQGVLDVVDAPLVSSDFNHDRHSSIFHADQTLIMGGDMVRVLSWYDNEWAFSNRMADTAVAMGKLI